MTGRCLPGPSRPRVTCSLHRHGLLPAPPLPHLFWSSRKKMGSARLPPWNAGVTPAGTGVNEPSCTPRGSSNKEALRALPWVPGVPWVTLGGDGQLLTSRDHTQAPGTPSGVFRCRAEQACGGGRPFPGIYQMFSKSFITLPYVGQIQAGSGRAPEVCGHVAQTFLSTSRLLSAPTHLDLYCPARAGGRGALVPAAARTPDRGVNLWEHGAGGRPTQNLEHSAPQLTEMPL